MCVDARPPPTAASSILRAASRAPPAGSSSLAPARRVLQTAPCQDGSKQPPSLQSQGARALLQTPGVVGRAVLSPRTCGPGVGPCLSGSGAGAGRGPPPTPTPQARLVQDQKPLHAWGLWVNPLQGEQTVQLGRDTTGPQTLRRCTRAGPSGLAREWPQAAHSHR